MQKELLLDFVIKYSSIIEPHCFSLGLEQGQEQLMRCWPSEWISFIHGLDESSISILLQQDLLTILEDHPNGINPGHLQLEQWPKSLFDFINDCKKLKSCLSPTRLNLPVQKYDDSRGKLKMSRKKEHEVSRLASLVLSVAKETCTDVIVDIGSGSGYLTHSLAQHYPIIAIEGDEKQIKHSVDRGETIFSWKNDTKPIFHVSMWADAESLQRILEDEFRWCKSTKTLIRDPNSMINERPRFLLTALHACGDLSSETMLKPFVACASVCAVVSVGCCYQHLSQKGFPLSRHFASNCEKPNPRSKSPSSHAIPRKLNMYPFRLIKKFQDSIQQQEQQEQQANHCNHKLEPCYRLFNCACQTVVNFSVNRIRDMWQAHCYRAMLNSFLHEKMGLSVDFDGGDLCDSFRIGNLKADDFRHGFLHYAKIVSRRSRLDFNPMEMERHVSAIDQNKLLLQIAFLSTIRRLLGPCIESLVIMDRLLYLEENALTTDDAVIEGSIIEIFDHKLSPRNLCILGIRKSTGQF